MNPEAFSTLIGLGPIGVLAIVIWILMRREERDRQDRLTKEQLDREALKAESESRVTLATALTALSASQADLSRQIQEWTR